MAVLRPDLIVKSTSSSKQAQKVAISRLGDIFPSLHGLFANLES